MSPIHISKELKKIGLFLQDIDNEGNIEHVVEHQYNDFNKQFLAFIKGQTDPWRFPKKKTKMKKGRTFYTSG